MSNKNRTPAVVNSPDALRELMELKPESLAERQEAALAEFAAQRLENIAKLIREKSYGDVENLLSNSPAGDGHGCDNSYICFADVVPDISGNGADLGTVIFELKRLRQIQLPETPRTKRGTRG